MAVLLRFSDCGLSCRCSKSYIQTSQVQAFFVPVRFLLTRHALDVALDFIEVQREFASLLKRLSAASTVTHVFHDEGGFIPF
jgi:hypothetical protein